MHRAFLLILLSSIALPALASDGVREINQTCATQTGCFPGDDPGWPVTIDTPGSYRLTSNLDVGVPGGAVHITSASTTLDLAGFAVRFCIDPPPGFACLLAGQDDGIEGADAVDVTVKNGAVQGFRGWGVDLNARGWVEGLVVRANSLGGIRVGTNSLVQNNRIGFNGGTGAMMSLGTGWGNNVLVTNDTQFGGAPVELSRNVCNNTVCTRTEWRRVYLSPDSYSEAESSSACGEGFRRAKGAELHDPASLYYDSEAGGGIPGLSFQEGTYGWLASATCRIARWEGSQWSIVAPSCTERHRVWCIEE